MNVTQTTSVERENFSINFLLFLLNNSFSSAINTSLVLSNTSLEETLSLFVSGSQIRKETRLPKWYNQSKAQQEGL